jgi:hypothetical protein
MARLPHGCAQSRRGRLQRREGSDRDLVIIEGDEASASAAIEHEAEKQLPVIDGELLRMGMLLDDSL